ncbi:MAG: hypothetical protein ACRCZR_02265 [Cetobacterium sp.]
MSVGSTINSQAKQDKYSTSIKSAYGLATTEEKLRILSYLQKNQSKGHERFAFYKSGRLQGVKAATSTYDSANHNFADKKGEDIRGFISSVFVTPTLSEVPIWKDKHDDLTTNLDVDSKLVEGQVSALNLISIEKILTPITTLAKLAKGARKITVNTKNATEELTMPLENQFGDKSKGFLEQEDLFFEMLSTMETVSTGNGMKSNIALMFGTKTNAVLKSYDRATNRDYITSGDFETKQGNKLSIKKFDVAELIPLANFDNFVGKEYIVGILDQAIGYDSLGEPESIRSEEATKGAVFYNIEEMNASTVVDIEGIFIFEYNGTLKGAAATRAAK